MMIFVTDRRRVRICGLRWIINDLKLQLTLRDQVGLCFSRARQSLRDGSSCCYKSENWMANEATLEST